MKKSILQPQKMNILILCMLFLIACSNKTTDTTEIITDTKLKETGVNNKCDDNSDCWCRGFDGAKFYDDIKEQSMCCLDSLSSTCQKLNYCKQCTYM
ncbi:MAG: hypothetical protein HQK83_18500 [Fibrobacteria bacterium]|nr:hypothetical protein [Fibrobacteria bacterium]